MSESLFQVYSSPVALIRPDGIISCIELSLSNHQLFESFSGTEWYECNRHILNLAIATFR